MSTHFDSAHSGEPELDMTDSCGYPAGSFACKIRHLQINTGQAKAAVDMGHAAPSRPPKGVEYG